MPLSDRTPRAFQHHGIGKYARRFSPALGNEVASRGSRMLSMMPVLSAQCERMGIVTEVVEAKTAMRRKAIHHTQTLLHSQFGSSHFAARTVRPGGCASHQGSVRCMS